MGNSCATGASPALLVETHDPSFKWKVYGFSALLEREAPSATSTLFHCGGYNWFLRVTPAHKRSGDGIQCVALNLALRPIGFKPGHIINTVFELLMYNHLSGTYYGGKASYNFDFKNPHSQKTCMIPLEELLKSSDYLVDDSCVLGVRILKADVSYPVKKPNMISKKSVTVQNLFFQKKDFIKGTYTWTMNNYLDSKLPIFCPAFEVGGRKWHIYMYPLGDQYSTNSLSLYLKMHDLNEVPDPESAMMVELTVTILNQKHGQHYSVRGRFVFAAGNKACWGWPNFIPLNSFKDPSSGYLVGSNCTLKADITIIGSSNDS